MVEKHYCDVCGQETKNQRNIELFTSSDEQDSTFFDGCTDCVLKKTIPTIVIALKKSIRGFYSKTTYAVKFTGQLELK